MNALSDESQPIPPKYGIYIGGFGVKYWQITHYVFDEKYGADVMPCPIKNHPGKGFTPCEVSYHPGPQEAAEAHAAHINKITYKLGPNRGCFTVIDSEAMAIHVYLSPKPPSPSPSPSPPDVCEIKRKRLNDEIDALIAQLQTVPPSTPLPSA